MDKFLAALHKKPDHHKKRFALLVSGTITLFIFGIWSLVTFPPKTNQPIAGDSNNGSNVSEVSPFESLRMSLGSSFEALQTSFQELKNGTLEIYGQ